jgi:hypothetical protein
LSKSTLNLLDISKELPWQQDFTFINEKAEGSTRIVTAKVAGGTGTTTEAEWVFVPEEGVWKLDLLESAKRSLDSYKSRQ